MEIALTVVGMLLAFVTGALTSNPALLDKVFRPTQNNAVTAQNEAVSDEEKERIEREKDLAEQYANLMRYVGLPQKKAGEVE